jgi:DNA-binding transcriptional LysR family regulator
MLPVNLSPDVLETFLAVARTLNYTRAAGEVHLSQPAVSRQVRQLEAAFGARLFDLIGKRVHLTDAGRALVPAAERVLGEVARAAELVRAVGDAEHGHLRIGASTTPGVYLVPKVLGRFHARHPAVEIDYRLANTLRIEEMIIRNELDLGFVGAHLASEELLTEPIATDTIVGFAHPAHRLARRRRVEAREVADEVVVTREEGSATRRLVEAWLAGAGGAVRRTIEVGSLEAIKAIVAGGLGISFLSRFAIEDDLRRGRFALVRIAAPPLRRSVNLVRHPQKYLSPAVEAFLDLVHAESSHLIKRRSR